MWLRVKYHTPAQTCLLSAGTKPKTVLEMLKNISLLHNSVKCPSKPLHSLVLYSACGEKCSRALISRFLYNSINRLDCKRCTGSSPPYLAIGPVNLVDHISQQNLLLHSAVEFLILGVLADLQVVSLEGLVHAEIKQRRQRYSQCKDIHSEMYSLHHSFIE